MIKPDRLAVGAIERLRRRPPEVEDLLGSQRPSMVTKAIHHSAERKQTSANATPASFVGVERVPRCRRRVTAKGTHRMDRQVMASFFERQLPVRWATYDRKLIRMLASSAFVNVAFFDIGGTLWPDEWPSLPGDRAERIGCLCGRVEQLSELDAARLVDSLSSVKHPASARQQTHQLVIDTVHRCGLTGLVTAEAEIEAMCLPAAGHIELFPDARRLFDALSGRGRVVLVSNTMWRDRHAARRDFEQFGLAGQVNDYLMSIDVSWRKPASRFFAAALSSGERHQTIA